MVIIFLNEWQLYVEQSDMTFHIRIVLVMTTLHRKIKVAQYLLMFLLLNNSLTNLQTKAIAIIPNITVPYTRDILNLDLKTTKSSC